MGYIIFILLLAVPIVEIGVFIEVGGLIGLWPTITVIFVTAAIGAALLRAQGLAVMYRAQEAMARGEMPLTQVFDGLCLLFAGAMLLTPGFVTDGVGFLLFIPPLRILLRR
ncbi:MAG: FxsA family protein, partial [Rhodospirillales bacterium]